MKPNRKTNPFLRTVTLASTAAVVTVISSSIAHAADITWNNTGTDFNTGASWTGAVAPGTADRAVFAVAAVTSPALSAPKTVLGLSFSTTASSGYTVSGSAITLTSTGTGATSAINAANNVAASVNTISAPVILGGAAATTASFTQANNGTLVVSGNISSTNLITGLYLQGNNGQTLVYTLSGTNSYNGTTQTGWVKVNLNSDTALGTGNLVVVNNVALGNTSGSARTLANGLTVSTPMNFVGVGAAEALTFGGAVTQNSNITVGNTGPVTFNGTVTASTGSRVLTVSNATGLLTLNGALNVGSFRTEKAGNGTMVLTQATTGAGLAATIGTTTSYVSSMRLSGGTLVIPSQAALGAGVDTGSGTRYALDFRGGYLAGSVALTGANALTNPLVHATGTPGFGGSNNLQVNGEYILNHGAGNQTLNIANTGSTLLAGAVSMTDHVSAIDSQTLTVSVAATAGAAEISGVIQNKTAAAFAGSVGKFIKTGAGALTLSGANTFSGGLDVTGGTLVANHVSALGASTNAINVTGTGSILQFGGNNSYTLGGPLTVGTGAVLKFGLTSTSGVNSKITGTGTAQFSGIFDILLPASAPSDGASWMVVDPALNESYLPTFTVTGWEGSVGTGKWQKSDVNGVYTFTQSTGMVTFASDLDSDGLEDTWEIGYFGDVATVSGADDGDGDGYSNLQEQAGGSNPTVTASVPGDFDGDTLRDSWELANFGNLDTGNVDSDSDAFDNFAEMTAGSSPNDSAWTPVKAKIAHRWSFTGGLNDSVGTSHATIVEVGANNVTLGASSVTLAGGTQATSDYLNLGPNLIGGKTAPVTLELWATPNTVQNWSQVFNFGSSTTETLFMSWTRGADINLSRVQWVDNTGTSTLDNNVTPYTLGTKFHIVMTLTPAAYTGGAIASGTRVTWFRAAVGSNTPLWNQRGTFDSPNTLATFNDVNNWLGRSAWGDNTASVTYDEVRLWDGVFTENERRTAQAAGPDVTDLTTDSDADGLPDSWETAYFGDIAQLDVDSDSDGAINSEELLAQSNPNNINSTLTDSDADGLEDAFELTYFGNLDKDGTQDFDGDLATNEHEETAGSFPNDALSWPNTDGDSLNDGWELFYFSDLDEVDAGDPDADGENNLTEFTAKTNPTDPLSRSSLPTLHSFINATTRNGQFELQGAAPGIASGTKRASWDQAGANDVTYWSEWTTQSTAPNDSGVEGGLGLQHAFMQAGNAVYNLSDYVAAEGKTYWFALDKLNALAVEAYLVYQDAGGVIQPIASSLLISTSATNGQIKGYQIPVGSPAIGRKIGIGFKSPGAWSSIDNVKLGVVAADSDSDTYDDAFEDYAWGDNDGLVETSDLTAGPAGDGDGDGVASSDEINGTLNTAYGSAPTKANDSDSDDDGLSDGLEILTYGSNPNLADTDGDKLSDGVEVNTHGTNPVLVDTDGDTHNDYREVILGSNPLVADAPTYPVMHDLISVTKRNGGFELSGAEPGTVAVTTAAMTHWDTDPDGDVTYWTNWTELATATNDAGTERGAGVGAEGLRRAWCQGGNATRNMTNYAVKAGDLVRVTWNQIDGTLNCYLVYNDGGVFKAVTGAPLATTAAATTGDLLYQIPADSPAIGKVIGVGFKNPGGGYPHFDAVTLSVEEVDSDGDYLSDFDEDFWFGNKDEYPSPAELNLAKGDETQTSLTGDGDSDDDGLSNADEINVYHSNPLLADHDADGLSDGYEVNTSSTNLLDADSDDDGLSDGYEVNTTTTNPNAADTDGDGWSDSLEPAYGTNPLVADSVPAVHELIGLKKRNGSFQFINNGVANDLNINTGWDTVGNDVDNWSTWTEQSVAFTDTGVEPGGSDGSIRGYIQNGAAVRNMTPYIVKAGDVIRLTYDHVNAGTLNAYLIYGSGGSYLQIPTTAVKTTTTVPASHELTFTVPVGSPVIGSPLGVAFKSTLNWAGVDKVVLTVKDIDSDTDGLSDFWEEQYWGNNDENIVAADLEFATGTGDNDSDTFNNEAEEIAGSNPTLVASIPNDVDGDSLADTWEVANFAGSLAQVGSGDPDLDTFNNEAEETAGSNPNDVNSFPVTNNPDADSDGIEDEWETTYFGGTTQAATGDFDNDGTDNLTEFRLGLIPNSGTSHFAVTRSSSGSLQWQSVLGVTFRIERSTTLEVGSWTTLEAAFPGTAGTANYTDAEPPVGKAFYRIGLNP